MVLSRTETVNFMKSDDYRRRWRRRLSCFKKSVFLPLEGHVLGCRKASSCTLWSMYWIWKRRKKLTLRAKKVFYPWPFLEWRGSNDCSPPSESGAGGRTTFCRGILVAMFLLVEGWKGAEPPNVKKAETLFWISAFVFYDDDKIVRICIRSLSVVYAVIISLSQ